MKTWQNVANDVVTKIQARGATLEKELKRVKISVQALMDQRAYNHHMVMADADWKAFEAAMLINGYGVVRFGLTHVGLVSLNYVTEWPRVKIADDTENPDEAQD